MKPNFTLFLFATIVSTFGITANAQESVEGYWLTDDKELIIEVKACEVGSPNLCGFIIDIPSQTADSDNLRQHDESVCGLPMIANLSFNSQKNRWDNGEIFDIETEKMYGVILKLDKGKLKVRAYDKHEIMGQNFWWDRVERSDIFCRKLLD